MKISIKKNELVEYIVKQLNFFFPDKNKISNYDVSRLIDDTLDRLNFCFKPFKVKYYYDGKNSLFNHLNSDHYCTFLYFLSNNAYRQNNIDLADKLFYLNKALHSIDIFYSVKMPDIFMLIHPIGSIIGNASYKNYTVFYHGVTVGSSIEGIYPEFSENTVFCSKSLVIGNCKIGKNVTFSANASCIDTDIPDNTLVFGTAPNNILKEAKLKYTDYIFLDEKYINKTIENN